MTFVQKPIYCYLISFVFLNFSCSSTEPNAGTMEVIEEQMEEEMQEVEEETYSYLALGDSYTIGEGVSEEDRWPMQLQKALLNDSIVIDSLKIIAQTGWTTTNLLSAIETANPGQYDMVSLLIGVNNQYQGKPFALFEEELNILLDKAISIATDASAVFVVSIPDYGVTPFGANNAEQIGLELDEYNAYTKEQCSLRNIPYINITEISRQLGSGSGALASDNLHPSGYQYGRWVGEILPIVVQLLEE